MNLEAVYPNDNDPTEELSFEELRAKSRGWLCQDWAAESKRRIAVESQQLAVPETATTAIAATVTNDEDTQNSQVKPDSQNGLNSQLENAVPVDLSRESRTARPRKTKIREVKGETQTSISYLPRVPDQLAYTRQLKPILSRRQDQS